MACPPRGPTALLVPTRQAAGAAEKSRGATYQEGRCVHRHPARTSCQRHTPGGGPAGWGTWRPPGGSPRGHRWARWRWRRDAGPSLPGRTLGGTDRLTRCPASGSHGARIHAGKGVTTVWSRQRPPCRWTRLTCKLILRTLLSTLPLHAFHLSITTIHNNKVIRKNKKCKTLN